MRHFLTKLVSTLRIVTTLALARTFGHYEVSVSDYDFEYARYHWRGKIWAFPTKPLGDSWL